MSVKPEDFYSDQPPPRIIGSESEYDISFIDDRRQKMLIEIVDQSWLIHRKIPNVMGYLGHDYGGGRVYLDGNLLEFCTQEAPGPAAAAVQSKLGIDHFRSIVSSARVHHNGIYRGSGTQPGSNQVSGEHGNYIVPRSVIERPHFMQIITSAIAAQAWNGAGQLKDEAFVTAQKIWHCDATSQGLRYTTYPMVRISGHRTDDKHNVFDDKEWARFENCSGDAELSLMAQFLGHASTSLALRIPEQAPKLSLTIKHIEGVLLKKPLVAAQRFAGDPTYTATADTKAGDRVTALDLQERYLDIYETFEDRSIELPDDEVFGIQVLRHAIDALRASKPATADYTTDALQLIDYAPRHQYIANGNSETAEVRDRAWSQIEPSGPGEQYWLNTEQDDPMALQVQQLADKAGSLPRALARADKVDSGEYFAAFNWASYRLSGHAQVPTSFGSAAG